jgi:transcriptional regulator with XRE-family HTH domain
MGRINFHAANLTVLQTGLKKRVERGLDAKELTQYQLAQLSGVPQGNLSKILAGRPATEATWQKLFDVAWPE